MIVSAEIASFLGIIIGLIVLAVGVTKFGRGVDGTWSLANVQLAVWTSVVLGSYVALSLASDGFLSMVPSNTLVLFAISAGTLPASSIIRATQEKKGNRGVRRLEGVLKVGDKTVTPFLGGFLAAEKDPEQPSLAKMQMFAWNIIAALLLIWFVAENMRNGIYQLPDIGATLSAIIGVSNGAYAVNKAADTPP